VIDTRGYSLGSRDAIRSRSSSSARSFGSVSLSLMNTLYSDERNGNAEIRVLVSAVVSPVQLQPLFPELSLQSQDSSQRASFPSPILRWSGSHETDSPSAFATVRPTSARALPKFPLTGNSPCSLRLARRSPGGGADQTRGRYRASDCIRDTSSALPSSSTSCGHWGRRVELVRRCHPGGYWTLQLHRGTHET